MSILPSHVEGSVFEAGADWGNSVRSSHCDCWVSSPSNTYRLAELLTLNTLKHVIIMVGITGTLNNSAPMWNAILFIQSNRNRKNPAQALPLPPFSSWVMTTFPIIPSASPVWGQLSAWGSFSWALRRRCEWLGFVLFPFLPLMWFSRRASASPALSARCSETRVWRFARALEQLRRSVKAARWWSCCVSETVRLGSAVIQLNVVQCSCALSILHPIAVDT